MVSKTQEDLMCIQCRERAATQKTTPECLQQGNSNTTDGVVCTDGDGVEIKGYCDLMKEKLRKITRGDDQYDVSKHVEYTEESDIYIEVAEIPKLQQSSFWRQTVTSDPPTSTELGLLKKYVLGYLSGARGGQIKRVTAFTLYLSCYTGSKIDALCGYVDSSSQLTSMANGIGKVMLQAAELSSDDRLKMLRKRIKKAQELEKKKRRYTSHYLRLTDGCTALVRKYRGRNKFAKLDGSPITLDGTIVVQDTLGCENSDNKRVVWNIKNGQVSNVATTMPDKSGVLKINNRPFSESSPKLLKELSAKEFKSRWLSYLFDEVL